MIYNLDNRKFQLIKKIMEIDNETSIEVLENQVENLEKKASFLEAIKPIRKSISIEEMIAEQSYKPIDATKFFKQASAIGIEESIEELLEMLD
jgi:hypothetical protein